MNVVLGRDQNMKKFLALFIFSWHLLAQSAPGVPIDAMRELKATHRPFDLKSFTMGRLGPKAGQDVVVVIREEEGPDGATGQTEPASHHNLSYRIVWLTEKKNESAKYVLHKQTAQLGEFIRIYEFDVEIRGESLFVRITSSNVTSPETRYQFKYVRGELRLIGAESSASYDIEDTFLHYKTSVNFLTGSKTYREERTLNGKKTVSRVQSRFSPPVVRLEGFELIGGYEKY
jgi:hypothetical protein